ncbi:MAG: BTAD domain-containing putative transcriptional regulator [Chloroflexota bacterium]
MTKKLSLSLLGKLQITKAGKTITGFDSNKARAALCYLAVTKQTHYRTNLLGLLWGEMPETEAKANLRVVLSNLRKLVGAHLIITRQTVAFNIDAPHDLDIDGLERIAVSNGDIAALEGAIHRYRGDFLAGFQVREAPEFENWLLIQRERLRQIAVKVLETIVTHYTDQGKTGYAAAITYTQHLLSVEPWREEAHQQLMLLLARDGQRSAALKQYQVCQATLKRELDVEPALETQNLNQRIRAMRSGPRHNLPSQLTRFVGRQGALKRIKEQLADPACRLLTLIGPGGIGKTRLALEAAEQQLPNFLEGVYFVRLSGIISPSLLVSTLASTLGLTFYDKEAPHIQPLNYLRSKEILLLLDSFEHLLSPHKNADAPDITLLSQILSQAPQVKLLVTSRERLNLRSEWLLEIEGLHYPEPSLDDETLINHWGSYSAIQLFLECLHQTDKAIGSVQEKLAVARICQLIEGLPLGIALAASWSRNASYQEMCTQIEHNLDSLVTTQQDVPARHQSLRAVFEHSWQTLSETEKAVLKKLSIFQSNFSRVTAEKVVKAPVLVLSALVDKSLLHQAERQRYEIHPMIRQYSLEKLQETPQTQTMICQAHSRYYLHLLQAHEPALKSNTRKAALEKISDEIDNIRLAWLWAVDQKNRAAVLNCLDSLHLFYDLQIWYEDGIEALEQAIKGFTGQASLTDTVTAKTVKQEDALLIGRILTRMGELQFDLDRYDLARAYTDKGIDFFRCWLRQRISPLA